MPTYLLSIRSSASRVLISHTRNPTNKIATRGITVGEADTRNIKDNKVDIKAKRLYMIIGVVQLLFLMRRQCFAIGKDIKSESAITIDRIDVAASTSDEGVLVKPTNTAGMAEKPSIMIKIVFMCMALSIFLGISMSLLLISVLPNGDSPFKSYAMAAAGCM